MTSAGDQAELEQKLKLLAQHRRNLNYLQQQAAQYGLDVPLPLHNAVAAEREAIAVLERELAALGVSPQSKAGWQALIIDADSHWREIVVNYISQLGGAVVECETIPIDDQDELIAACAVAIVSASGYTPTDPLTQEWIKDMIRLGHHLPIILLASWDDRDTTIALRQAFRTDGSDHTITTIFKETLDLHWLSRIIQQILIR